MKPVKPKLDLVIAHLEAEQKSLKRMIKKAAPESDDLIVYYHSGALNQINSRLDVLYTFKDPLHSNKRRLRL